jgi:hypothetical protein
MPRSMTTAMEAAVVADVVRPVYAVELDFGSGWVRANSTPYTLTINGSSSLGIGTFGGIAPIEETGELSAYQMALQLYGVPRDLIGIALAEHYQGRTARIFFGAMNESHAVIADPVLFFAGRMDAMKIDLGETATVTLTVENRLADWDRERVRRYTSEDQAAVYPGDKFFDYVPKMQDITLKWGRS